MKPLVIEPTATSPAVLLDPDSGKMVFSGRSYPENTALFYKPILDWMQQYARQPALSTECSFKIEYFNSASRKCIVDILRVLESLHRASRSVTVFWDHDKTDDGMKETGEEYRSLFTLNFVFRTYS